MKSYLESELVERAEKFPFPVNFLGRFAGQAAPSQGLHDFVAVDPFKDSGWKRELEEGRTLSGRSYGVVNGRFDYAGEDDSHYPLAAYEDRFDTYDKYMGRQFDLQPPKDELGEAETNH